ncbi:ATP-binding protein [Colwellia ponticola]|uniref:histidine kinase n=1 Tax=Colwellia ponticola TaxID=2304625 RepID=A0A8H2JNG6_9GAMM|nr:ATP-binding protein [Colwellia ponticola]TMM47752.1 response regulator [Colwellia ponticola]
MIKKRKKIILLFCLLTMVTLVVADKVWAHDSALQQQLNQISEHDDKTQALAELSQLINVGDFDGAGQVRILLLQGRTLFLLHEYEEGIKVVQQARDIAAANVFLGLVAKANKLLGVLRHYQGELKSALIAYQQSLDYYETHQDLVANNFAIERANLLNNIALIYTSLGQASLALVNYKLAEPLYSAYGDEVDKVDIRYNIAVLHLSLKRFDSTISMLKETILKRQQLNDNLGVAKATATLGVAYKDSGQFKLAEENILAALTYFQQHDYKHDIAAQLHNISEVYNNIADVEQAIFYANKALNMSQQIGHQKAYAGSLQSLAKGYFYSGDLAEAEHYINESIAVAQKNDYQDLLTENLAISALVSASQHHFVEALAKQQRYRQKYLLAANNLLNEKLAEFESKQLSQKIVDLEQRRKLQTLEAVKTEQQRNLIILSVVFIFVVVFFIYRRYLEQRLTKELEWRVKQRTHELETLTHELEKANQVKSQFLANMSHEIRTPLTAIIGHAEALIYDDVDKSKFRQDIEVVHGNSLHLLDLINDILDLSRIEANKLELEIQPLDLSDLIQDLRDTFNAQAQQKNLVFTIAHQLPLPFVIEIDSLRLKQILLNLCANAIKFTEKGSVTLNITWLNDELVFTVTDTGIGLSEAHLAQVFEIFTQADNSISRRFGGSGLGLTLSNQLAKLMSGNIAVTSKLGHGSCFCLSLPCLHNICDNGVPLPSRLLANHDGKLFNGKILLAEDHGDNRRLIARLLTRLGLDTIVATNGKEAVAQCIKHQPDLVLLDIQMPEMDGVEAFQTLRDLGCTQPIYALTANAMSHEVSKYLDLGFTGHLKKPIERTAFIAAIAKHCTVCDERADASDSALIHTKLENFKSESSVLASNSIKKDIEKDIEQPALIARAEQSLLALDLSDLVAKFKANLSNDKRELILYRDNNDINKVAALAHRLAGAAQMFGFVELNQAASELELAIKKTTVIDEAAQLLISELMHCLIDEINLIEQQ